MTSSTTAGTVARAIAALPATAAAGDRARLEGLADDLARLTRLQYGAAAPAGTPDVVDVLRRARDAARDLARARRWTFGRPAAPAPVPLAREL